MVDLLLPLHQVDVEVLNIEEMNFAMMTITTWDVTLMVVIAVVMMSTHNTAQFAPVWIRIIKDTTDTTGVGENKEIKY